jgi:hypothetical protein
VELWELVARESIRDTIAQYAYAGDRLMVEEMAAAFCEDGVLETQRDHGTWVGRAAIIERLGGGRGASSAQVRAQARAERAPGERAVRRHVITNIYFQELMPGEASVSSYFTVLAEYGLDHFGRYRDLLVPVNGRWLFKRRVVARDWQRPDPARPLG